MKNIILVFILILSTLYISYANDSISIKQLHEKVSLLEVYKNEILDKKVDLKTSELSNKIEFQLKKAEDNINDKLWIFGIVGTSVGIVLTLGIGTVVYQHIVGFKRYVDKVLKDKLDSQLSDSSGPIIELITSQRIENIIKTKRKILVLAGNNEELNGTEKLLRVMGFKNLSKKVVKEFTPLEENDLTVFANCKQAISNELINDFLEQCVDDANFIYFGGRDFKPRGDNDYSEILNFANNKFTLYHQIINTLTFKDIFKNSNND